MERVAESNNPCFSSGKTESTRNLDGAFGRFSTTVREEYPPEAGMPEQQSRKCHLTISLKIIGDMQRCSDLLLNGTKNPGMSVTKCVDSNSGKQIEITTSIPCINVHSFGTLNAERQRVVGGEKNILFVGRHVGVAGSEGLNRVVAQ
jgi:hypothetical protein